MPPGAASSGRSACTCFGQRGQVPCSRVYSRDHRSDRMQIPCGLLRRADGCPVEVFDGATNDHRTVGRQIEKLKARFGLDHVVLEGDRGMGSETTIRKELEPLGLDWVAALKSSSVRKRAEAKVITPSLFDTAQVAEIQHPDLPGERLIACFNPPKPNGGKKATGRTTEGLVATRYRDLLRELVGYARNTMRFASAPQANLILHPTPSPLQQRAFDLLGINPGQSSEPAHPISR